MKKAAMSMVVLSSFLLAGCNTQQQAPEPQGLQKGAGDSSLDRNEVAGGNVSVSFTNIVVTSKDEESTPILKVQQPITVLTYTSSSVPSSGPEKYVTFLKNHSAYPATVSGSVTDSYSGTISGGIDQNSIKATIGFTGTYTKTATVTAGPIPGGAVVNVYSAPAVTKYFGYQRTAPVGVDWQWCNQNSQYCGPLTSWSASNVTGIGFVVR